MSVKAYVKRGKTDAADAEAICEAVTRPTMRFVAVKITEQPGVLMLHKTRDLLVRQRTMLINALRGHFTERGIIAAQGAAGVKAAIEAIHTAQDGLPALARNALHGLIDQMRALAREIDKIEKTILTWHSKNAAIRRLAANPRYRANHDERHHGSDTRCDTILLKQPQREAEFLDRTPSQSQCADPDLCPLEERHDHRQRKALRERAAGRHYRRGVSGKLARRQAWSKNSRCDGRSMALTCLCRSARRRHGDLRNRLRAPFRQLEPSVPPIFRPQPPLLHAA
jgi:hypothetical protein